jgi:hypothetical protein
MRRRVVVLLVAGALTVGGVVAQSVGQTPAAVASSTSPSIGADTLLTNTTLGGFSQVDQVDMLSPHLGTRWRRTMSARTSGPANRNERSLFGAVMVMQ